MEQTQNLFKKKFLVFGVVKCLKNFWGGGGGNKKNKQTKTHNNVYFAINIVLVATSVLVNVPVNVLGTEASWYRMTHIHTIRNLLTYKTLP